MRILYCTDIVLDERLAPTIHIDAICSNFAALGHEVVLFVPRDERNTEVSPLYAVKVIQSPRFLLTLWYQPRLFFWLVTEMLSNRPNLLYVRHSHLLIVPTIVGRVFGVPVFLEINGILEQDARHINQTLRSRLLLATGIFSFFERINARLATRIIAVTEGIKQYFVAQYHVAQERIAVIPNGVDTDFFRPMSRDEARRKIGLENDAMYVGYVGSLHEWQGTRFLVEAAKNMAQNNTRFMIVGSGEEKPFLESYIHEHKLTNVELRNAIPHDEVPLYINSFDICISYPLKFRDGATSPFKVYEYLACGKPVVSSDLAGIRAEFGDVLTYAKAEDTESLAKAIRELIDNPERRSAAGTAGRVFVEKDHGWRSVAQKIISLCETNL